MSKKKDLADSNEMVNFYKVKGIQDFLTDYHNPNFEQTQIKIPFRISVIASSGGGKTQWLLNLIARTNDTWGHIYICYRTAEPLYQLLERSVGAEKITFFTSLSKFIQPADLPKEKQVLMVFDDVVNYSDKEQNLIKEYYIRGRKMNKGVSICYLSQSFFKIPKIIRLQCNYLILLKLGSKRDLNLILADYGLGVERDELMAIYKDASQIPFNFLKVSTDERDDNRRFSKNWTQFYTISDDEEKTT